MSKMLSKEEIVALALFKCGIKLDRESSVYKDTAVLGGVLSAIGYFSTSHSISPKTEQQKQQKWYTVRNRMIKDKILPYPCTVNAREVHVRLKRLWYHEQ